MRKKVVVIGGGTGESTLLRGLKQFPIDITAIVTVADDGRSTGRLREEFNIPAVGDIRQVLIALSSVEPTAQEILNYRFKTTSDLNGHTVGNLLLTAATNVTGSVSRGIESLSKVLNLQGKVLPLTEDNVTLVGHMTDGSIIEGEHFITDSHKIIDDISYLSDPVINPEALHEIETCDLIVISMGSLYTSIMPNLIAKDVVNSIEKSKAKIVYVANMMTQPGETDNYTVSDHIKALNKHLGNRHVDMVIVNTGKIQPHLIKKYASEEQKDPVVFDEEAINKMGVQIITDDFVILDSKQIRHNTMKLAFHIFSNLI
jgi:uncharacterized cofD-like protein